MFVLSFNAARYFQLKKKFIYFLIFFFLNNARKSCALFMEILFPHEKFLHGKILPRNPLPPTHPPPRGKKSPRKRLYNNFIITITMCKHGQSL